MPQPSPAGPSPAGSRVQQLALQLEPRGILYVKLTLVEQWDMPNAREPRVFGVELRQLVERENAVLKVPLLIQKCVARIERCGLKVRGDPFPLCWDGWSTGA